jgi:hypothetical protein
LLLGDLGQQMDLSDQKHELASLRRQVRHSRGSAADARRQGRQLQDDIDELRLYLAATIRLLVSKGAITRDEMTQFVEIIDGEDGEADGKFQGDVTPPAEGPRLRKPPSE